MVFILLAMVAFAVTGYFVRQAALGQLLSVSIVVFLTAALWLTGRV